MMSTTKIPRLLILGYCYPPTVSPEGFVTAKLLRNVPDCKIDVLTLDNGLVGPFLDSEMGNYAEKIPGRVIRVGASTLIRKISNFPRLPFRPDRWIVLNHIVSSKVRKLLLRERYDCFVTRSQYHSSHLVGLKLKRRNPEIPWIACFSDPWSNADHQVSVPVFSNWSDMQERKVLECADCLVFPTEGLRDHFTNGDFALNAKSAILPHSFDASLYARKKSPGKSFGSSVTLRLFGSFYGARTPDALFSAINRLNLESQINITLEVFGAWHPSYAEFEDQNGGCKKKHVRYMGQVPHLDALREMQDADLLVVVDAPGKGSSFYLPSKLVDYLGSGTPILSLCRPGVVCDITRKAGGIVADPSDVYGISEAIRNWLNARERKYSPSALTLSNYEARCVGRKFRDLVGCLLDEKVTEK